MTLMEIVSGMGVNGAIVHCLRLTRELARRGHSMTVVCRPDSWICRELRSASVQIVESNLEREPLDELQRIAAIVRSGHFQIIHTHMTSAHLFGLFLSRLSSAPCVATAHAHNRHWHWRFNDLVIAVSEATRRYHLGYNMVAADRIEVIHNFVDCEPFIAVASDARKRIRASFGVEVSWPLIGFVGNVFVEKGWLELVRVLAKVSRSMTDVRLLVVGEGPTDYRATLENEAARLGVLSRIIWAGRRFDIPEMLSALDLFVTASHDEAFSLSLLEAMAAGLAVVASAVGGLPELICHGETGFLVPPGDLDTMASLTAILLRDKVRRNKFGEAGRRHVGDRFSPETLLPRLEAAFARVIAESN